MIALVANPIIQARLQAEMDLVIGKDRLPTFADREKMPYMQAIVSETLRCVLLRSVRAIHAELHSVHLVNLNLSLSTSRLTSPCNLV